MAEKYDLSESANQLLAALPAREYDRIAEHLEEISLSRGEVLLEAGSTIDYVYFPNRAGISFVSILEDGATTEVGMVGNEGIVGYPVFLGGECVPHRTIVQISGKAARMDAKILKTEFERGGVLQKLVLRHTQALLFQVAQTAACNRHHPLEKRLARWLLTAQDCVLSDRLHLTQEFVANMLGTRRAGVTEAEGVLQTKGIISHSRGQITILDRRGLEAAACECYRTIARHSEKLLYHQDDCATPEGD